MSEIIQFFTFSPLLSFSFSSVLFLGLTLYTWNKFEQKEKHFFNSADSDCREFVRESYSNPDAPLGNFKSPTYGPSKNIALTTMVLGLTFLSVAAFFANYSFITLSVLVTGLFYAQKLFWFDAKHLFLPDEDVYGFGLAGLAFGVLQGGTYDWHAVAITALSLSAFLWLIMAGFRIFLNKEGMGFGDVKLLMAMLPSLGTLTLSHALFVASILGIIWWAWNKIAEKSIKNSTPISATMPFGPFLILGWGVALIHQKIAFLPW
jgi:prepilin signal peptidase PulO-like enzyme (type II secretory pathway)